jgi:CBS-domain-containing membrane protein
LSARAASRLATLGFNVYRYQAGRADWFAAGLAREGRDAHVPRVADVAKRDVQTCRLDERVGDVRPRVGANSGEPLIVVDPDRVVLGFVTREALTSDPATPVEEVMDSAPVTFRPNLRAGEMPEYFGKHGREHALVTTSDGVLIGLVHLQPHNSGHGEAR